MSALRLAVCVLLLVPLSSSAAPKKARVDPKIEQEAERLEIAREHFQKGEALMAQGQLEGALVEYELAELAHPSPSLTEAKRRTQAQLDAHHAAPPVVLVEPAPAPPAQHRAPLGRFIAPIVLAPLAVASLVVGGVLLGTVHHDVGHLAGTCSPNCTSSDVQPLKTRQTAAFALIGVGAGLAVVDALLWGVLATRHASDRTRAAIEPSFTSVRGRF